MFLVLLHPMLTVTPDLFTDLADKKFVADTARLISGNSSRMYAGLDKAGQTQVDQLVEHVRRLPDYHYYLKNLDEGDAMRDASEAALSGGPSCAIILLAVAGAILAFIVVNIAGMNIASILLLLVGIVLLSSAVVMTVLRRRVSQAQQTIEELEDTVDLERFTALEEEFESPEEVEEKQKQAEQFIEGFFGDYTLLQGGWRT